jgi:hypothetical protein
VKTKEQTLTPARKKIVKPGRPIIQKMRLHIQPGKTTEIAPLQEQQDMSIPVINHPFSRVRGLQASPIPQDAEYSGENPNRPVSNK